MSTEPTAPRPPSRPEARPAGAPTAPRHERSEPEVETELVRILEFVWTTRAGQQLVVYLDRTWLH